MSLKGTTLSKEGLEYLCGLIRDINGLDTNLIDDLNIKSNGTFSSVRINTLLNALKTDCNDYTDSLVSNISRLELKIVTDEADIVDSNILYLHKPTGQTSYNQYVVIEGNKVLLGTTDINMTDYYTITQADNKFVLKTDFDALKTEVTNIKTDIGTDDISLVGTSVKDAINKLNTNKIGKSDINTTIDNTSTDDTIPSSKSVYDYIGTLNSLTGDIEYGNFKLIGNYTITSATETLVKELIPFTGLLNSEGNMVSNNGLIALKKGKTYKITSAIRTNDVSSTDNGYIEFSLCDNKGNILKQGKANNGIIIRGNYPINYTITPNENISVGIYITYRTPPIKTIVGENRSYLTITEIPNPTSIMNVTDNHIKEVTNTYSTNEMIIGKWIDGKPIYRKVIDLGVLPNTDTVKIPHNINDLDRIISMRGMAKSPNQNLLLPFPYGTGNDGFNSDGTVKVNSVPINIYEQQGNIVVYTLSDRSNMTGYVILEYIKTIN